jgi:hypothetical protein
VVFVLSTTPAHAQGIEESAEKAVATGTLRIKSSPAGARVWIDHVEVGRTPHEAEVSAGIHNVRIAADFHQPYALNVKVVAHRTRPITADLKKGNGAVEIDTDLEGATITIKGKVFDKFPLRLKSLKENTYSYRAIAPGHEPLEGEFTWKKGKNIFIWIDLESSLGRFIVSTDPPGATIMLDGEDVGVSPIELEGIDQGKHVVHIHSKGYADMIRIVDTSDGSQGDLNLPLTKKGARIVVHTGSKDGMLLVEGVELAQGRKVVFSKLEKGRYGVEIKAPGKKTATGRLVVPNRGFTRFKGKLKKEDSRNRSTIEKMKPFYAHWAFWTAIGVTAGGSTTGSILYWNAIQPIPIPTGDQRVSVP